MGMSWGPIKSSGRRDRMMLLAWAQTGVVLFGCVLLLLCVFQIVLLITNRIIIKWNHDNDFPHGKDPYFLMLHMSAHRSDMRVKLMALRVSVRGGGGVCSEFLNG